MLCKTLYSRHRSFSKLTTALVVPDTSVYSSCKVLPPSSSRKASSKQYFSSGVWPFAEPFWLQLTISMAFWSIGKNSINSIQLQNCIILRMNTILQVFLKNVFLVRYVTETRLIHLKNKLVTKNCSKNITNNFCVVKYV